MSSYGSLKLGKRNDSKPTQYRIHSFFEKYSYSHLILAYHAAFPIVLTTDLLYCIWTNFQFDTKGRPLNIPWLAVSDLLLCDLFKEGWNNLYQIDNSVRNSLLSYLQLDSRFGKKRLNELASFLLAYIHDQPNILDLDDQDLINSQRRAALVYLQPGQVANELALTLSKEYGRNDSEVIRTAMQVETLSVPLKNANYESLIAHAWGMKELIYQEKTSSFDGLVQLDRDSREVYEQFYQILRDDPLKVFLLGEEEEIKNYDQSALEIISVARKEAVHFGHDFVNPEHILLGILQQVDSWIVDFLVGLGVSPKDFRTELEQYDAAKNFRKDLSVLSIPQRNTFRYIELTLCSKRVLAFSREEAHRLGHKYISVEHLLLGLIQEGENLASVVLDKLKVNLLEIRAKVIQKISPKTYVNTRFNSFDHINFDKYGPDAMMTLQSAKKLSMIWSYRQNKYIEQGDGFTNTGHILLEILKEKKIASIVASCSKKSFEEDIVTSAQKRATPRVFFTEKEGDFTPRAKRSLFYAQEELEQLGHRYINTTHLLLGLIRERDNEASTILANLEVDFLKLKTLIEHMIDVNQHESIKGGACQILTDLGVNLSVIRPNTLSRLTDLINLSTDEEGKGLQILTDLGINLSVIRPNTLNRLEFLTDLSTDSDGRAIQILINSDIDLSVFRSQVLNRLEFLTDLSTDSGGRAIQILINSGVDLSAIRPQVLEHIRSSFSTDKCTQKVIYAINFAIEEARQLQHNFVGTEKLLLGLIAESTGKAAKVLKSQSVNLKKARVEIEKIIIDKPMIISSIPSNYPELHVTSNKRLDITSNEPANKRVVVDRSCGVLLGTIVGWGMGFWIGAFAALPGFGAMIGLIIGRVIMMQLMTNSSRYTTSHEPKKNTRKHISSVIKTNTNESKRTKNQVPKYNNLKTSKEFTGNSNLQKTSNITTSTTSSVMNAQMPGLEEEIAFTPKAQKSLVLATKIALQMNVNKMDTEHLLLALIQDSEGIAFKILENLNVHVSSLPAELLETKSAEHDLN